MNKVDRLADLSALPPSGQVIVGFSAGADSMALTHFLFRNIEKSRILCVHINHMLRAEESQRDEAIAEAFCLQLGLRFQVFREDIAKLAKHQKMGLEECGRNFRYRCFESFVKNPNDRIITAHHADDHAETILMNLAKGTALTGLCGIPYQRENIIRPFLFVPRKEIEGYCQDYHLTFANDSSNESDDYTRNWVRHHVVPAMQKMNPLFVESVSLTAQSLRLDEDYLQEQACELLKKAKTAGGLSAEVLKKAHLSIRRRAVKRYMEESGADRLTYLHIEQAANLMHNGARLTIPGGKQLECSAGILSVHYAEKPKAWAVTIKDEKTLLPNGKVLILQKNSFYDIINSKKINNLLFNSSFGCDTIYRDLVARSRKDGDRFAPVGRKITKTLKNLFYEEKVPRFERNEKVILEYQGKIVFVEGIGVSEEFQVREDSQYCITVRIEERK